MGITRADVDHVAALARLRLDGAEREEMVRHLGRILEHMEVLGRLETGGVEPTSHVLDLTDVLREDAVVPSAPREALLGLAPEAEKGHYRVPKVIADAD
jgi:aspartyl-tRNA(Asn)/glutamyl-tRNA(Gln) amidotransferase subunit C